MAFLSVGLVIFALAFNCAVSKGLAATAATTPPPTREQWEQKLADKWSNTARDCSSFVPLEEQRWLAANPPPSLNSSAALTIPMDYLHACIRNISYDRTVPPFELDLTPRISYAFGICEVHDLSFDGSLRFKASFYFEWPENRLRYKQEVSFAKGTGWHFPHHLELPAKELWTPTFRLANCKMSECTIAPSNETIARLLWDGLAEFWLHTMLTATCEMELKNFPFDEQNCSLIFIMPDIHRGDLFQLVPLNTTHLEYMYDNDEWIVESHTHEQQPGLIYMLEALFDGGKFNGSWKTSNDMSNLIMFRANLTLTRYPDFYFCNIILPTLIVTIVNMLTVFVPMEHEGKLELSVTILLAFIFLQGLVSANTPKQPNMPLLGMYILFALILSGVNLVIVVLTLAVHNYGDDDSSIPPLWLRVFGIRIWRWPLMATKRIAGCLCKSARARHSSPVPRPPADKEQLAVEAEEHECHEVTVAPSVRTTKETANKSSSKWCNAERLDESWKVLARYLEVIASALFLALQTYTFVEFLYPLLALWAEHKEVKPYSDY